WSARDFLGTMIKAVQDELTAVDDRTFRWVLKKPFPKMLLARQDGWAHGRHYAGSNRGYRSVQANRRARRLRPRALSSRGMGAGRQGRVRNVRGLCATRRARLVARRRQGHEV